MERIYRQVRYRGIGLRRCRQYPQKINLSPEYRVADNPPATMQMLGHQDVCVKILAW
jgi:hypothetical protein